MSLDAVVGKPLGGFELQDLDDNVWTPNRLRGAPTVVFCFATW